MHTTETALQLEMPFKYNGRGLGIPEIEEVQSEMETELESSHGIVVQGKASDHETCVVQK